MAELGKFGDWQCLRPLGRGGQGEVFLAQRYREPAEVLLEKVMSSVRDAAGYVQVERTRGAEALVALIRDLAKEVVVANDAEVGALKVLHPREDGAAVAKATARMKQELEAQSRFKHPSLVRILESQPNQHWFVMEYFPGGTLDNNLERFRGDVDASFRAFRPLVAAVAELHKNEYIHRDIKPGNVFIGDDGRLVLGDFGLIFQSDAEVERITSTYENVGSRDWMPPWAMGIRSDQVKPSFDVFGLGKILWSMISGKHVLPLWYYDKPEFDIELAFPNNEELRWASAIFRTCIVEDEKDCVSDATVLLKQVDKVIEAIKYGGQVLRKKIVSIRCRICGVGTCSGSIPYAGETMRLLCTNCGYEHVFNDVKNRPGWE